MASSPCPDCRKQRRCRLRQPGTWVTECEEYAPRPAGAPAEEDVLETRGDGAEEGQEGEGVRSV